MDTATTDNPLKYKILDAVDQLLGRFGYKKMTVDDVAQAAGIGKGTVYLYFRSKEEMALSSIDRLIDRLIVRLEEMAAGDDPLPEKLMRMLVERVLFRFDNLRQDSQSLDAMFAVIRPAFLARRRFYFDREAAVFSAVLEADASSATLPGGMAEKTARAFIDATNSLLPYSLSSQELGDRGDLEDKVRRIAQVLVAGVASPGGASPSRTSTRNPSRRTSP